MPSAVEDRSRAAVKCCLGELLDEEPRSRRGEQAPDLGQLVVVEVATDVRRIRSHCRGGARVGQERGLLAGAQVAGRRTCPDRAGSPKTPRRSSTSWKEIPSTRPASPSWATVSSSAAASTAPGLQGQGEGVGAGLLLLHRQALAQRRAADAEREAYVGQLARGGRVQRRVEEVEQPVLTSVGAPQVATARTAAVRARSPARIAGGAAVRRGLLGGGPGVVGPGVEGAAHVGPAAAHVVAVDDVVVDHEGRVEQLDRRPHVGRGGRGGAAEGVVGRDHERRPEPLAALGGRGQRVPEAGVVGTGRRRARAAAVEQPTQGLIGAG